MELTDGTYLKLGHLYHRIEIDHGYWVGVKETDLESVNSGTLFGVWIDDTGKKWIDLVDYEYNQTNAIRKGRKYNQIAIYDNANQETILINI